MPKVDLEKIVPAPAGEMPPEFADAAIGRIVRQLSAAAGLTDFVATHVVVPSGRWSAQRHRHEGEDELAVVLAGEGTLVDDAGRHPLQAGDVTAYPKGDGNAHHIVNTGSTPLVLLAVSLPERSPVHYPDIGRRWTPGEGVSVEL